MGRKASMVFTANFPREVKNKKLKYTYTFQHINMGLNVTTHGKRYSSSATTKP